MTDIGKLIHKSFDGNEAYAKIDLQSHFQRPRLDEEEKELLKQIHQNGFVILENVLSKEDVEEIRNETQSIDCYLNHLLWVGHQLV